MTHAYGGHDSFICRTWLIHTLDMTHSCVWHDSSTCATWLISMFSHQPFAHLHLHSHVWMSQDTHINESITMSPSHMSHITHGSAMDGPCQHMYARDIRSHAFTYIGTWLIHMCDMTHAYVWHDSFICGTWLIHTLDITQSHVWHDTSLCSLASFQLHCVTTHSCVGHDSFIRATWLIPMFPRQPFSCLYLRAHVWMSRDTHINESRDIYGWDLNQSWTSHVTHMDESCHTYTGVESHRGVSHVWTMHKACHTHDQDASPVSTTHVVHIQMPSHT